MRTARQPYCVRRSRGIPPSPLVGGTWDKPISPVSTAAQRKTGRKGSGWPGPPSSDLSSLSRAQATAWKDWVWPSGGRRTKAARSGISAKRKPIHQSIDRRVPRPGPGRVRPHIRRPHVDRWARAASRFALGPVGGVSDPIPYPVWDGRPLKASDGVLVWCTDAVGRLLFAGLLPHLLTRTEQIVLPPIHG